MRSSGSGTVPTHRTRRGDDGTEEDLAADVVAGVTGEVGQFEDAGGEDDRGGEQEREVGGVFVVEAA